MANNTKGRRDFMGMALGGFTALGGIGALYAMKRTWDPLPSVKAAGFTTIDLSAAQPNVLNVEKWRGKPIFVLKKAKDMKTDPRDVVMGDDHFLVAIGLCTHLGCIPAYLGDEHKFKCACHGGEFDASGHQIFGPPPSPLEIPPFKIDGTKLVLGEEGPEYQKMKADGLTV
ncbi:ubiquinol-cytochrome c reductase iron-sulfur subunit [Sulfurovum riftiae]|uniref:Ubiquinol-cytochrome c reductase iron-sulfur subunit n=1 Tax=Sulfurovum riftiae TaxID=1630136 RepID=A0A151CH12_9BACT|nr:ubiquinol-cytochrome c reductase iron-sulfur subunit [Sulfurovum riftiae]KYJ86816.1 ubiquinol-cytochrome c reductase iron-sulfur subunit [Sulfurovum riftiae]